MVAGYRRIVKASLVVLLAIAAWLTLVDSSVFVHVCPDCGYTEDVHAYRFAGYHLSETVVSSPTALSCIAEELGSPCNHPAMMTLHRRKYWGLIFCGCPCTGGIVTFNDDIGWYVGDGTISCIVNMLGKCHTELGEEFYQHAIIEHDGAYVREFKAMVNAIHDSMCDSLAGHLAKFEAEQARPGRIIASQRQESEEDDAHREDGQKEDVIENGTTR